VYSTNHSTEYNSDFNGGVCGTTRIFGTHYFWYDHINYFTVTSPNQAFANYWKYETITFLFKNKIMSCLTL
jgi:hypothetical protein